eukprot:CAMPEP_0172754792 /NCGR_PEP_ID=MMETSP1074-20121228/158662_1 /TAXON_ID=2916 /ORGANISM="Ceratium fusus, Strain PA161109" /LENGTH=100 /DNA_ID=CAMNT_0013587783 /DNA_START=117 /DNA_END=420 /DNA_ORIENTATION=-
MTNKMAVHQQALLACPRARHVRQRVKTNVTIAIKSDMQIPREGAVQAHKPHCSTLADDWNECHCTPTYQDETRGFLRNANEQQSCDHPLWSGLWAASTIL